MSVFLLMEWLNSGSNLKSVGETDRLVNGVLHHPEFKASDFEGFSTHHENQRLDKVDADAVGTPFSGDGWTMSAVNISVPTGRKDPAGTGHSFTIQGLNHRPLLGVLNAALADVSSKRFHFSLFKRFRVLSFGHKERCYDEVYTSDALFKAEIHCRSRKMSQTATLKRLFSV